MLISEHYINVLGYGRNSYRAMRLARLGFLVPIGAFLRKLPVAQYADPVYEDLLSLRLADSYVDHWPDQDIPYTNVAMKDIAQFSSVTMGCHRHCISFMRCDTTRLGWAYRRCNSIGCEPTACRT